MKKKIAFSILLFFVFIIFAALIGDPYEIAKTPVTGSLAIDQFQDSNAAYVKSIWEINIMNHFHPNAMALFLLMVSLLLIWKADLKKLIAGIMCLTVCALAMPDAANAYYAKTDYTEVVEILPNQTAFLIPEVGENKKDQASFMSVDYLNANKAAMKRITIPHVKLVGSSMIADTYVPAARLLIIDRTPSTREWVTATERGTGTKDEGFRFESAESINIETGIVISAFVKEEDAAKFVYWFGAKKLADGAVMTDEQRFASVIEARSLAEVIDDNVRRKVQSVLAREFGKYSLVDAAAHKADIISIVDKEVKDTFLPMGITVSYVGYAEGLTYDKEIQASINSVFLAQKKAQAAEQLMASVPYEQAMVNINMINAQADAIKTTAGKWNGAIQLPNWVILPQGLTDTIGGWLGHNKTTTVTPTVATK